MHSDPAAPCLLDVRPVGHPRGGRRLLSGRLQPNHTAKVLSRDAARMSGTDPLRTFVACEARVQAARGPRLPGGRLPSCPPERAPPVPPPLLRSAGHPAAPSNRQLLNAGMHATIVG